MAELRKTIAGTYKLKGQGYDLGLCNNFNATQKIATASKIIESEAVYMKAENFCPALIAGAADAPIGLKGLMDFFRTPVPGDYFANRNAKIEPKNIEFLEDTLAVAFLTRDKVDIALAPNPEFLVEVRDKAAAIAGAAWAGPNPNKSLAAELPAMVIRSNERARKREGKPALTAEQKTQLTVDLAKQVAALPPLAVGQIKACFADSIQANGSIVMQNKLACALAGESFAKSLMNPPR